MDLNDWIRKLPRAHLGDMTRLVLLRLQREQQRELDPGRRLRELLLMAEPVLFIADGIERHFRHNNADAQVRQRKAGAIAAELCRLMAGGFRRADTEGSIASRYDKLLAAMGRMVFLERSILIAYRQHCAPDEGLWREVDDVYQQAKAARLHTLAVAANSPLTNSGSNVEAVYKRLALLRRIDPFSLDRQTLAGVYKDLAKAVSHCEVFESASAVEPSSRQAFGIRVDCEWLHNSARLPGAVNDITVRRLKALDVTSRRLYPRRGCCYEAQFVVGVPEIFRHLGGKLPAEMPTPAASHHRIDSASRVNRGVVRHVVEYDWSSRPVVAMPSSASVTPLNKPFSAQVRGSSVDGFTLVWTSVGSPPIEVGDWAALVARDSGEEVLHLVRIRWIRVEVDRVIAGAEVLDGRLSPVAYRAAADSISSWGLEDGWRAGLELRADNDENCALILENAARIDQRFEVMRGKFHALVQISAINAAARGFSAYAYDDEPTVTPESFQTLLNDLWFPPI